MEFLLKLVAGTVFVAVVVFLLIIAGTALGALAGLVVDVFFKDTMDTVFAAFGISELETWQLGAFLGFSGGFFRSSSSISSSKN